MSLEYLFTTIGLIISVYLVLRFLSPKTKFIKTRSPSEKENDDVSVKS